MRKYCAIIVGSLLLSGCVAGGADTGATSQATSAPATPEQASPEQAATDQASPDQAAPEQSTPDVASLNPDASEQTEVSETEVGQAALITANIYAHELQPTPDMTAEERVRLSSTIDELMNAVGLEQERYFEIMRGAEADEDLEQQIVAAMREL